MAADKPKRVPFFKRGILVPAIVSSGLALLLFLAMPELGIKYYIAAWFGTFFVWSIWNLSLALANEDPPEGY